MRSSTARALLVLLPLGVAAALAGAGLAALTASPGPGPAAIVRSPSPVAVIPSTTPAASVGSPPPSSAPSPTPSPTPSATPSPLTPTPTPSGPGPSPSSSPTASAAPVDVPPHDPAKFGFVAKGMRGEVMAFVTIPELAYARDTLDFSAVSTLAYFSLQAGADGTLLHDSRWRAWNGAVFDAVRDRGAIARRLQYRTAQDGVFAEFSLDALRGEAAFPFRLHLEQAQVTPLLLDRLRGHAHARRFAGNPP
jgi:hypothetical protein